MHKTLTINVQLHSPVNQVQARTTEPYQRTQHGQAKLDAQQHQYPGERPTKHKHHPTDVVLADHQ